SVGEPHSQSALAAERFRPHGAELGQRGTRSATQRRRPVDADQKGPAAARSEIFQAAVEVTGPLGESPWPVGWVELFAKPIAIAAAPMMGVACASTRPMSYATGSGKVIKIAA